MGPRSRELSIPPPPAPVLAPGCGFSGTGSDPYVTQEIDIVIGALTSVMNTTGACEYDRVRDVAQFPDDDDVGVCCNGRAAGFYVGLLGMAVGVVVSYWRLVLAAGVSLTLLDGEAESTCSPARLPGGVFRIGP